MDTYGYKPYYFEFTKDNDTLALIPFMLIDSWLTGKRLVSLPFSDYCQPLISNDLNPEELFNKIFQFVSDPKVKYFEIRSTKNRYPFETDKFRTDQRHILKLGRTETDLLKSFSDNTKRNIKKAVKEGVVLSIQNNDNGMNIFYDMNVETRKKHGLPPQPKRFFQMLNKNIIQNGMGEILIAESNGEPISSCIYLKFGKKLVYKFGASYSKYFELRGNHFVMWEAIKRYLAEGFEEFDFGRTEIGHDGLRRFKLGWNTEESSIFTTRFDFRTNEFLNASISTQGFHNRIFEKSPELILKIIGNVLYKHIG